MMMNIVHSRSKGRTVESCPWLLLVPCSQPEHSPMWAVYVLSERVLWAPKHWKRERGGPGPPGKTEVWTHTHTLIRHITYISTYAARHRMARSSARFMKIRSQKEWGIPPAPLNRVESRLCNSTVNRRQKNDNTHSTLVLDKGYFLITLLFGEIHVL